jgi:hypothetical protein
MLAFGAWSAMAAGRIEQGLATPWVGVVERISFYSWHVWFIVLALTLLRQRIVATPDRGVRKEVPTTVPATTVHPSSSP